MSRPSYSTASVALGQSCANYLVNESGVCANGTAMWPHISDFSATCREQESRYLAASVPYGSGCTSAVATRTCTRGVCGDWSGTAYANRSCAVAGASSCMYNGVSIPHGANHTRTRYTTSVAPTGAACTTVAVSETATCNNGTLGWPAVSSRFDSCSESRVSYAVASPGLGMSCSAQTQNRTCTLGACTAWNGTNAAPSCTETQVRFATASVPFDQSCASAVASRACTGGTCGAWSGTAYSLTACTVTPARTCVQNGRSYPHQTTLSVNRYTVASISGYDDTCNNHARSVSVVCYDGTWTPSAGSGSSALHEQCTDHVYRFSSAAPATGASCAGEDQTRTFVGGTLTQTSGHGYSESACTERRVRFRQAYVATASACSSETESRTCEAKPCEAVDWSSINHWSASTCQAGRACADGAHGQTRTRMRYDTPEVFTLRETCFEHGQSTTETCVDGSWSAPLVLTNVHERCVGDEFRFSADHGAFCQGASYRVQYDGQGIRTSLTPASASQPAYFATYAECAQQRTVFSRERVPNGESCAHHTLTLVRSCRSQPCETDQPWTSPGAASTVVTYPHCEEDPPAVVRRTIDGREAVVFGPIAAAADRQELALSAPLFNGLATAGYAGHYALMSDGSVWAVGPRVPPAKDNTFTQPMIQLSGGGGPLCGLAANGSVFCRMDSNDGFALSPVTGVSDAVEIAVSTGDSSACGRLKNGSVRCWGDGYLRVVRGARAANKTEFLTSFAVPDLTDAVSLSSGDGYFCARTATGGVRCWGMNRHSGSAAYGMLGDGTLHDYSVAAVAVVGVNGAARLSLGRDIACAHLTSGEVRCWGARWHGLPTQMLNGGRVDASSSYTTLAVAVPEFANSTQLFFSARDITNSYRQGVCRLVPPGKIQCWGQAIGTDLKARFCTGTNCFYRADLDAGFADLPPPSGTTWNANNRVIEMGPVGSVTPWFRSQDGTITLASPLQPYIFPRLTGVQELFLSTSTSCAFFTGGSRQCWPTYGVTWGYLYNELGNADASNRLDFSAFSDGGYMRAWVKDGKVRHLFAAITGVPDELTHTPLEVTGIANATAVQSADGVTCALMSDGRVACWGRKQAPVQFGLNETFSDEDTFPRVLPTALPGISDAIQIASNEYSRCMVLRSGRVKCWGEVFHKDGQVEFRKTPFEVAGLSGVSAITSTPAFTCALMDKRVKCWTGAGAPADAPTTDLQNGAIPNWVPGIEDATTLSKSGHLACAIVTDGRVKCWGHYPEYLVPQFVPGVRDAVSVSSNSYHACAVLRDGRVQCWMAPTNLAVDTFLPEMSPSQVRWDY